jgi:hypothetical protein
LTVAYEMCEDGTAQEVSVTRETLHSENVYCVIDSSSKSVFIWSGRNACVRKKFVGARNASRIRVEQGFNYRVKPVDEGEEPSDFINSL